MLMVSTSIGLRVDIFRENNLVLCLTRWHNYWILCISMPQKYQSSIPRLLYLKLLFDIFKFWSTKSSISICKSANQTWMWNVCGLTRWHIYWILCISIHQEFPSSISSSSISSTSLRYLQVLKLQLSFANNICPKICSDMNVKRLGSDMLTHLLNLLHYHFTDVPSSIS